MREIPVQEAVGLVLFHDITRIVPGEFAGRAFKKGHIILEDDIPQLLNLGKDNIYVLDLAEATSTKTRLPRGLPKRFAAKASA